MSPLIREMRDGEADQVAAMVRDLARDIGKDFVPRLTGSRLGESLDLIDVVVAESEDRLVGACLSLMTYSTWRAAKGLYVVDLFVDAGLRGRNVGLELLKFAAARGAKKGARFIKLEVDHTNAGAQRFYERLGFTRKDDRLFILEQDALEPLVQGKDN